MALPASDAFTGTNGNPLAGSWTDIISTFQIAGNMAQGGSGGFAISIWTGDTFAANHYAQCTVELTAFKGGGPAVRMDGSGNGYALVAYDTGANNVTLAKMVAGANTNIGTSFSMTSLQTLKLSITGTTLTCYLDGVLKDTVVDATYSTANRAGITSVATARVDDFLADNVGGGAGVVAKLLTLGAG